MFTINNNKGMGLILVALVMLLSACGENAADTANNSTVSNGAASSTTDSTNSTRVAEADLVKSTEETTQEPEACSATVPCEITSVTDLQNIQDDLSGHYILVANIDARETKDWNEGAGFEPLGDAYLDPFAGTLDGQGYEIQGLVINRPDESHVGVFRQIDDSGTVRNIGLTGGTFHGESTVGSIAAASSGTVENVFNTGAVEGQGGIGGLVGSMRNGAILSSHNTGAVTGTDEQIGGVVGAIAESTIKQSYNEGDVTGSQFVGGITGRSIIESEMSDVYNTGTVVGEYGYIGGVAGQSLGSEISNVYNTAQVSGQSNVGGVLGFSRDDTVRKSHNTGEVTGRDNVGGIAGAQTRGVISSSYNSGAVTATRLNNAGGLVGINNKGIIDTSYNKGEVAGIRSGGIAGTNEGGVIRQSFNISAVSGGRNVGGVSGINRGLIEDSYNHGTVHSAGYGVMHVGGVVGKNDGWQEREERKGGKVHRTYSTGEITGRQQGSLGGVIGLNQDGGEVTHSFFDLAASGVTQSDGGESKSTAEMQQVSTYTEWDFEKVWVIEESSYPQLLNSAPAGAVKAEQ